LVKFMEIDKYVAKDRYVNLSKKGSLKWGNTIGSKCKLRKSISQQMTLLLLLTTPVPCHLCSRRKDLTLMHRN